MVKYCTKSQGCLPEVRLDLHLSPQLVLHSRLLQLLLEEHLQGQDELCLSLSGQVDIAKFTFSKGTTNVKVFQAPSTPVQAETCIITEENPNKYCNLTED